MKAARILVRVAVWLLVAAVALALGAAAAVWLLVRTDEGRKPLARAIAMRLGQEIDGTASLRMTELDFDGRVVVQDVAVRDSAGRPVATAARVALRLDVGSLLDGRIRIGEVAVVRPDVHVYAQGPWLSLPHQAPPVAGAAGGRAGTDIGRVVLLDGTVAVERPGGRVIQARVPWGVARPGDGALIGIALADLAPGDAGIAHPGGRVAAIVARARDGAPWRVWARGASFVATATVAPDLDSADATVRMTDVQPQALDARAKPGRVSGLAVVRAGGLGKAVARAQAAAVAGSVIVHASGEYDGERIDDLLAVGTGSLDRSTTALEVASPAGQGRALLRLKRDGGVMVFDEGSYFAGQVSAIERWIPQDPQQPPVSGSADVEIKLHGPVTQPTVEGTVRLGDNVVVNAGPLGRIRAKGGVRILAGGRLALDRVKLAWDAGTIVVSGELDAKDAKNGDLELRLRVTGLDLAKAQRSLAPASRKDAPLAGKLTAVVDVSRHGRTVTADADGAIDALRWRTGQDPVDVPQLTAVLHGRRLTVDATLAGHDDAGRVAVSLGATAPRDPFDGAAWLRVGPDQVSKAHASFDGDLAWLAALAGVPPEATGRAAGDIDLVDNPRRLAFTLTGSELARGDLDRGGLVVHGSIDGHTTAIDSAAATLDDEPLASGSGTIDRGLSDLAGGGLAGARATGKITVTDVPLRRLRPFGWTRDDVTGRITATLDVDGPLAAPKLTIDGRLAQARIEGVEFSAVMGRGTLAGRTFTGLVHARQKGGGTIDASGSWDGVAGTVDGKIGSKSFDLAFLRAFAQDTGDPLSEVGGLLDANVRVSGSITAPQGSVDAKITRGTILLDEGIRQIERIALIGALAGGKLDVTTLTIRSGEGHLSAIGSATLVDLLPVDLHLALSARRLRLFAGGTLAEIDADGSIAGKVSGRAWTLAARVQRGTVRLPDEDTERLQSLGALEDVVFVDRRAMRGRILALADLFRPRPASTSVRIAVDLGDGVKLESPSVKALIDGDLVLLHQGKLEITGTLTALEGRAKIYGRLYDVIQGTAAFNGSIPSDPALNILLSHEFRSAVVYVHIAGTADSPQVALTSDPSFYNSEILGLVLSGDPDDRPLGDRPLESRAATLTSQLLADQVRQLITDVVRIDYISLDLGGPGPYGGGSVGAGRWFGDSLVVVRYRPTPEPDENTIEAQLSFEVWRRWVVEAIGGERGIFSADFLHTWRF